MEKQSILTIGQVNELTSELMAHHELNKSEYGYLQSCGQIYLSFLQEKRQALSLSLPHYQPVLLQSLIQYLHYIWIIHRLYSKPAIAISEDCELFDYFSYRDADRYERTRGRFVLAFVCQGKEHFVFEENTRIRNDRFLPLFTKGSVENHEAEIYAGFPLFSAIARSGFIPNPVLIDLDQDSLVILHNNMPGNPKSFLANFVNTSAFDTDAERDTILESLIEREISSSLAIGYPYHSNVDQVVSRVMQDRSNYFSLKLFSRLFYRDITSDDLVLLPLIEGQTLASISLRLLEFHQVCHTQHHPMLYYALAALKITWQSAGLNPYQYPFPSRWLMLIHQGETLEFYLTQAEGDFPALRGGMLMEFQAVIRIVYQVNWLEEYLPHDRRAILVMPAMPTYSKVLQSAKNYLSTCFKAVEELKTQQSLQPSAQPVVLLDPFNKVLLANWLFQPNANQLRIPVPDFIHFACQPYMAYHVARYIFDPLTEGASKVYDSMHKENSELWKVLSNKLLSSARSRLSNYLSFYLPKPEVPELLSIEAAIDTVGLDSQEVRELMTVKQTKAKSFQLEITTAAGFTQKLMSYQMVLVNLGGEIIQLMASETKVGQYFASTEGFFKQIDKEAIAKKLSQISQQAKNWKHLLAEASMETQHLYLTLKSRGLSIKAHTFDTTYLASTPSSGALSLPRSRQDWQIVGDFLGISDIALAWVNHKGWSSQNALRQAYAEVVRTVLDYYSGEFTTQKVLLERVNQIINQVAEHPEDVRLQERYARTIIELVCENIEFQEITDIKYHEPK